MTTWHPDTCDCQITFQLPAADFDWANITADHIASVTPCEAHAGQPIEVFNQVYHGENKIKNMLLAYVQANADTLPAAPVNKINLTLSAQADSTPCTFCSAYGVPGTLTFDANRIPTYTGHGLDSATLQAWADQTFGVGKVVVG